MGSDTKIDIPAWARGLKPAGQLIDKAFSFPYYKSKEVIPYKEALMLTAKVTSKGQITIPKEVRDKLGIQPGESLGFEREGGVFYIRKTLKKSPFDRWVGRLKARRGHKTDEIIDDLRGR